MFYLLECDVEPDTPCQASPSISDEVDRQSAIVTAAHELPTHDHVKSKAVEATH